MLRDKSQSYAYRFPRFLLPATVSFPGLKDMIQNHHYSTDSDCGISSAANSDPDWACSKGKLHSTKAGIAYHQHILRHAPTACLQSLKGFLVAPRISTTITPANMLLLTQFFPAQGRAMRRFVVILGAPCELLMSVLRILGGCV